MRSIGGASAHPENEQSSAGGASAGDAGRSLFNARHIQLRDDLGRLGEKILGKALSMKAAAAHFRTAPRRLNKLPHLFQSCGGTDFVKALVHLHGGQLPALEKLSYKHRPGP